jgi:hypothetical protein
MIFWTKCKSRRLPGDVLERIRADVLREFGEGLTVAYAASDGGVKTDNPALDPKKLRAFLGKAARRHWVIENAPSRNAVNYGRMKDAGKTPPVTRHSNNVITFRRLW